MDKKTQSVVWARHFERDRFCDKHRGRLYQNSIERYMMSALIVDVKKMGEAALLVEKDINEALTELKVMRVSASKKAITPEFVMKKITEIIEILER